MDRLTLPQGICMMASTDYCQQHRDCYECTHGRNAFKSLSAYEDTGLTPEEIGAMQTENTTLKKAFALACRILEDSIGSPAPDDGGDLPDHWQDNLLNRARNEQICKVCGCTQDNACTGGCYWVDVDLCSRCAERIDFK